MCKNLQKSYCFKESRTPFRKSDTPLARGYSLPFWFQGNFCGFVCFELLDGEFPFSAIANRFEFQCQSKVAFENFLCFPLRWKVEEEQEVRRSNGKFQRKTGEQPRTIFFSVRPSLISIHTSRSSSSRKNEENFRKQSLEKIVGEIEAGPVDLKHCISALL